MNPSSRPMDRAAEGIALIAVLMAMTLLLLLALPFSVAMGRGADAAVHAVEVQQAQLASASVRDLMLADAAFGHAFYDETPTYDGLDEFAAHVPDTFPQLRQEGRVTLGGELEDLQRYFGIDGVTPLTLSNLLGTTARLAEPLESESSTLRINGGANLPDEGWVLVDFELIHYRAREGNTLLDLERSQLTDRGFARAEDHQVIEGATVFDFRTIKAASWSFDGRTGGSRRDRIPLGGPGELVEVERAGFGGFSRADMDILERTVRGAVDITTAPVWGRPERVFHDLVPPSEEQPGTRRLVVKSALHLGAGSTVRIRDQQTGAFEYGLVIATSSEQPQNSELLLPSIFHLDLLEPVTQPFPALDTVVEPLVPAPVNVNTAPFAVLKALVEGCRRGKDVRVHEADGSERVRHDVPITAAEATALAEQILALRGEDGPGPFAGFQELAERLFLERFAAASDRGEKQRWMYLYRALQTGRDSTIEMGTAPICFRSGPLVRYRAAATVRRSIASAAIAARHERSGLAAAMPGLGLRRPWRTQEELEDAFRLDQRAPYWLTTPINTGVVASDPGNDPASRYFAHIVGMAFPELDFGEPRFPSRDRTDAAIVQAPAAVSYGRWPNSQAQRGHEGFSTAIDPRGWNVSREGPFLIRNTGPRGDGSGAAANPGGHQIRHAFTTAEAGGGAGRFAIGAWFEPESLASGTLIDYGDGFEERNRIALQARDGNLVFEVIDEAGLDPDPSQSPAGVPRTAGRWELPLGDLGLPANTPVHLAVSAYGNRPTDLAVEVDGMRRGARRFATVLTAPIDTLSLQQLQNLQPPGQFTGSNDPRYFTIQVEDTTGFPPVGVLRIGLELFEYTSISGNGFVCEYQDSSGGRGQRQTLRELRSDIPAGQDGRPSVAYGDLPQNDAAEFYPAHPVGATVELYGYSALPSPLSVMRAGETAVDGSIGAFAVARGFLGSGARPITVQVGNSTVSVGEGLDETWTGNLELADPVPTGDTLPAAASQAIADGFPTGGGYALLMQVPINVQPPLGAPVATSSSTPVGGIELIRFQARQGTQLTGVQRAQTLAGDNAGIGSSILDGQAHKFVTKWQMIDGGTSPPTSYNDFPNAILWVVPISLPMRSTADLADPSVSGYTEFLQFLPQGDTTDTEWVRYDVIAESRHVARGHRPAWMGVFRELTRMTARRDAQVGGTAPQELVTAPPWGAVTATRGYIGYIPQLESLFPQVHYARLRLGFRGDPFTQTSSHPQPNSTVLPVHRMGLEWGNYAARTARPARHDRVALVQGSAANGTNRPAVEWHTVNWSVRRYNFDATPGAGGPGSPPGASGPGGASAPSPGDFLGARPTQFVALQAPVRAVLIVGNPAASLTFDMRQMDRMVKFPSGELPAAYCESVPMGGAVAGGDQVNGFVDEIEVTDQTAQSLVLSIELLDTDRGFQVNQFGELTPQGLRFRGNDLSAGFPVSGGLVQIDDEVLAYTGHSAGTFVIAENGRGLLGTEPRSHARGAPVHFLTHRPAAILTSGVQPRSHELPIQEIGAMPNRYGSVLLARSELLHYTWVRKQGDQHSLEMPRLFEDGGADGDGLLRGRFGTTPVGAAAGEPVITMPFRYWDRHVERNDDPELSYFQLTTREAPSFFRTLSWREEVMDGLVDVACYVIADGLATLADDPETNPHLWRFERSAGDDRPAVLGVQATQLEVRFSAIYRPGCLDLLTHRAHGWKTRVRVDEIELEYEGQGRILFEEVTAR